MRTGSLGERNHAQGGPARVAQAAQAPIREIKGKESYEGEAVNCDAGIT